MELCDLVGTHYLSGVETGQMPVEEDSWSGQDECGFVKFTLDGVHYIAIEDPDDGYRSRCKDLVVSSDKPRYSFPPQEMLCYMKESDEDEANDILVMQDTKTGEIVLEVGTGNYNDWYPYCHFYYYPEGMACNAPDIPDDAFNNIITS